jgi:hypothetical protein
VELQAQIDSKVSGLDSASDAPVCLSVCAHTSPRGVSIQRTSTGSRENVKYHVKDVTEDNFFWDVVTCSVVETDRRFRDA